MSSSIEYAPTSLGSDIRFVRSVSQAYVFRQWRGVVLASAGRLGVATALGEQDLIPSERFFAGGAGTVRGVVEDSLGPRDFFFDEPTGGKAMVVLNQEVRVPIYRWVRGVGFVDAGNVFERWRDVRFGRSGWIDRCRRPAVDAVCAAACGLRASDLERIACAASTLHLRNRAGVLEACRVQWPSTRGRNLKVRESTLGPAVDRVIDRERSS